MAANSPPSFLPQYQDEVTQAQQMQMLAQLLASNKANTEGRMISGHYVRSNPLAHINNLAAGVGGLYGGNKSREMLAKVLLAKSETEVESILHAWAKTCKDMGIDEIIAERQKYFAELKI